MDVIVVKGTAVQKIDKKQNLRSLEMCLKTVDGGGNMTFLTLK